MPKVSEDHLAARRRQILDGARRCFAEYGYEKATVRRLEKAIGLSRGAIFHHFRDKDALFFALAHEDAERMAEVASREGLVQVMRDMLATPDQFDWLGTRLEIARKLRNDPEFRRGWTERSAELSAATTARLRRKGGRPAARRRAQRRPAGLSGSGPGRAGGPDGVRRRPTTPGLPCWIWSRDLGAAAAERISCRARTSGVRWLGPPRLRIVVPDSRSMLCTDPYDRPVVADQSADARAPLS